MLAHLLIAGGKSNDNTIITLGMAITKLNTILLQVSAQPSCLQYDQVRVTRNDHRRRNKTSRSTTWR